MRQIVVDPGAEQELRAAAQWYSEQEEGLGEEFVLEVNRAIEALADGAPRHPVWRQGSPYQKVLTHRFPYAVVAAANPTVDQLVKGPN